MLTKTPSDPSNSLPTATSPKKRARDPRLDFFRGIGMIIILIAHIPANGWAEVIPARFGFSDATEMFVFLSGMASAIAFGRVFDKGGFLQGTARIGLRVWQVYWAHVAVFIVVASMMALAGTAPNGKTYISGLNLQHFFGDPVTLLPAFMGLIYVPNYFDILPMYLVILAMMPLMLVTEKLHRFAPLGLMLVIWGGAQAGYLALPAEPWSDRTWFFNPFGWQLLFYFGFFLMRGTFPAPVDDRRLLIAAIAVVVLSIPLAWSVARHSAEILGYVAALVRPFGEKSSFGIIRLIHFSALAYLAVLAVGPGGARLGGWIVKVISNVGQQSLAVFITSMVIAQAIGIGLDKSGRDFLTMAVANGIGIGILVAVAYSVAWFKAAPWKA